MRQGHPKDPHKEVSALLVLIPALGSSVIGQTPGFWTLDVSPSFCVSSPIFFLMLHASRAFPMISLTALVFQEHFQPPYYVHLGSQLATNSLGLSRTLPWEIPGSIPPAFQLWFSIHHPHPQPWSLPSSSLTHMSLCSDALTCERNFSSLDKKSYSLTLPSLFLQLAKCLYSFQDQLLDLGGYLLPIPYLCTTTLL